MISKHKTINEHKKNELAGFIPPSLSFEKSDASVFSSDNRREESIASL